MLIGAFVLRAQTFGGYVETEAPGSADYFREYNFFASSTDPTAISTTTTATSTNVFTRFDSSGRIDDGAFNIAGAKEVIIYFQRGDTSGQGNSGSSRFRIQVSPDGSTWLDYNSLRQVMATSTTATNRIGSFTISAASSTDMFLMDASAFLKIRCIVVETTDGEHSCAATARF